MRKIGWLTTFVGLLSLVGNPASAGTWTWKDSFIAVFVDAEGINRHPASTYQGGGLQGYWAHALKGRIEFMIVPEAVCTKPIVGDLNNDCRVDFLDLAILASSWLQCNLDPAPLGELIHRSHP